ncbi:PREDICTED: uncharacterized protein LOC106747184 [Dinoponera quadriceps]|uniref:Uncharacterized protein LOC106747184 n=1 Tax=Dinoponera quadriceps TaxID=609295 RepID=A0A6P3XP83_DINQU|nr:PREDICTED: uncharacterized protein LOC106747184 [Dinoponera quadriceps]
MRMSTFSRTVKAGLRFFGIWPYLPLTWLTRSYWIISFVTAQVFQYIYVVNNEPSSFSEFMDGVGSTVTHSFTLIKLIILWVNQRKFKDILQMMTADWQNHTSKHQHLNIMTKTAFLASRMSRIIVGWNLCSVVMYSLGAIAANVGNPEKWKPYNRELILKMKFPFEISTHTIYVVVTLVQFIHLVFIGFTLGIFNSLLATLSLNEPNAAAILVKCIMFYISMNFEVFLYCYAGEYLSAKSKLIGDAAYDSLWYNVAAKNRRIVLFVVLRSQKRLTITCGKVMDLTLERFTSVMKASASYISVLLAMY